MRVLSTHILVYCTLASFEFKYKSEYNIVALVHLIELISFLSSIWYCTSAVRGQPEWISPFFLWGRLLGGLRPLVCVLLCFIKPILGNYYGLGVYSWASQGSTQPQLRIVYVPPHPILSQTTWEWPYPHPSTQLRRWLHRSPPLPLWTDPQLPCWGPGTFALVAPSSERVQSLFGLIGEQSHMLVAEKTGEFKKLENLAQSTLFESIVSARPTAAPCNRGQR